MILLEVAINLFTRTWFRIRSVTSARQACRKIDVLSLIRSQRQLACEGLYGCATNGQLRQQMWRHNRKRYDVTIKNKDLRRCVLSHWRFIQLSLRIVIISHWMLLHKSWTLYVSTNPSIYLHVYVVYFPRNGRTQRPHLRSVNVTVTSSWTFCFAGTTTRCSFGIND